MSERGVTLNEVLAMMEMAHDRMSSRSDAKRLLRIAAQILKAQAAELVTLRKAKAEAERSLIVIP